MSLKHVLFCVVKVRPDSESKSESIKKIILFIGIKAIIRYYYYLSFIPTLLSPLRTKNKYSRLEVQQSPLCLTKYFRSECSLLCKLDTVEPR